MPNINNVIARVDALKLNAYTSEEKARWLIELDGRIFREVMCCFGSYPPESYPEDAEKDLLVPSPYDVLYDYYLFAMIDFHNREIDNYQNSYLMFNDKYNDFAKVWQRTHRPLRSDSFDTMGYGHSSDLAPVNEVDGKIDSHNAAEASHPFIIKIIKQRYDALLVMIEQYADLLSGAALKADIETAVAEHQKSVFAHNGLFEELRNALSAHQTALAAKVDKVDGKDLSTNDFTDAWIDSIRSVFDEVIYTQGELDTHFADRSNPHKVTAEQVGTYTKEDIDEKVGDIEAALDRVLALQTSYLGGENE